MVVERSERSCLLCGAPFSGRAFLCRACADAYRGAPVPADVRRRFYEAIDRVYPTWSNTYEEYNPPVGLLAHLATLPRTARVLEIGAGGGFALAALARMGFRRLVGLDLTATSLAATRQRVPAAWLVAADAERLPLRDGSVDVVLTSDVMEHLPDLDRHLAEVARVLRPGGHYLIKTPNRRPAEAYYRLRGLYDYHFWHPSMCSPGELRRLLARHGFACAFVAPPRLTQAQCRKIPWPRLRPLAARVPIGWLPNGLRPHLEVVAVRR
ncbi:MAG: class I SAM-dependent methyltransferase [Sphaerobacter sp.]|nr:class I SAM-dependent methyltransferase [Sphaerobacter sp.]